MSFLCTATMKHELCKYRGYIKAINLNLNLNPPTNHRNSHYFVTMSYM